MNSLTYQIEEDQLDVSAKVLRALTHPLRMRILEYIDQHEMVNVNSIYSALQLEQSVTSQHLKILRSAKLVETERRGKFIHYRLRYGKLCTTIQAVKEFM